MGRVEQDLSGHRWQMERMRPGRGVEEGLHLLPAEYQGTHFSWNFASVPGDVYTDLQRAGEIDDPYVGRGMHRAKWVAEYEWWYCRRFAVDPEMRGSIIRLIFEGVDYSCDVWLNGTHLGRHEGMFSSFEFDVTDLVSWEDWRDGANMLMVKLDPPPKNYRNCGGKKVNFSGDYFSGLVPFGMWRPVRLEATGPVRIDAIRSDVTVQGDDHASVAVTAELVNHGDVEREVALATVLRGWNVDVDEVGTEVSVVAAPGRSSVSVQLDVDDARLWWPWDMGDQNLYDLAVEVRDEEGPLDAATERIGLREVEMRRNPGFTEEQVEFPWTFTINGKRHFLRSACWGGQPSFLYGRNSLQKYEDRVALVREANINNLRIFGWHPPETSEFYRLCDEAGITVWTNFSLATQAYPDDPEFVAGVVEECLAVVDARRNHPSQIFWMGGEEVFFSGAHERSGNLALMRAIGDAVATRTNVPYGLASPLSSEAGQRLGFKPNESMHANEHYYQCGAEFMEEYYPALDCAIIPELTAASAPDVESLRRFIPEDELWPMGVSWAYHWADIDMLKAINLEVFGEFRDGGLEEFVEATQVAQGTVIQFALETYRRRKPKMSGVSLCHFMTHVPDIKWGVIDYYGRKKASFDWLRRTYQPVLPSLEFAKRRWSPGERFEASAWVVNDLQRDLGTPVLEWSVVDATGATVASGSSSVDIPADSSVRVCPVSWELPDDASGTFRVLLELRGDAGQLGENEVVLLVGDQAEAKARSLAFKAEADERIREHGHSIYRYWPEMWVERDPD
ncbi:glycoside hydrolase family 2 protein [Agromyces sp. SYSU T0242]|uniref:glycoside hydrolase family 2 protein n=1 Tax=Agromyces litoreus TaxID=3158561 RepID=UPI0033949E72